MATVIPENYTTDSALTLKAAGLIATSAEVATIVDLGDALVECKLLIDVSALELDTNNELYDIVLQGSPDSDFGTDTNIHDLVSLTLAAAEVQRSDSNKDSTTGRYIVPFRNEADGTVYRYVRLYTVVAGTVSTGINYKATIVKDTVL